MLARLVNGAAWQAVPTWVIERNVAAAYMAVLTLGALALDFQGVRDAAGEILCAFGVLFTFAHMQVGSRLEEAQEDELQARAAALRAQRGRGPGPAVTVDSLRPAVVVECYAKLSRYLVIKELCWLAGFLLLGAWSALGGIPLFLFYPAWRRAYRRARRVVLFPSEAQP